MSLPTEIRCGKCGDKTGAWFSSGDPYLPHILCTDCAEAEIEAFYVEGGDA